MNFVKCTSPSCSKAPPKHDAANSVLHGWDGIFRACKPPPFSSIHNDGHYGQTVLFLFHQTRGHFPKEYDLCPHVQLQTVVWLFYGNFGAVASSLLRGISGYVDIGLILLGIYILLYLFPPASSLCCCSGIDFHFSHQSKSSLGDRTRLLPERYDGPMVFILA